MPETLREGLKVTPDVQWQISFEELGVEANFLSFWNKITAYNFGLDPVVFIDVYPVGPENERDEKFYETLERKIAEEIVKKVLGDEKKLQETFLEDFAYDPERKILSLVLFERDNDWSIPYAGKNELPL